MKVSLGMHLQSGPWGGGNRFGRSLVQYLQEHGAEVHFDLRQPDLDLILLTEPRANLKISAFSYKDIFRYLRRNPKALVVHRINDCDERRGAHKINKIIINANACADHTVFISSWLRRLFAGHGLDVSQSSVLLNGGNREIFNAYGHRPWPGSGKIKLITHHWGAAWQKGFDIYERLDTMLANPPYAQQLEFTYVGNLPDGFSFKQARFLPPQSGAELANTLRDHHIYLTAAQHEPAGMHHIEGALCGLPLLYRESGALPEYCCGFGVSFTSENFEARLHEIIDRYPSWQEKMQTYPHSARQMCQNYYQLFLHLLEQRDEIIRRRSRLRRAFWSVRSLW